MAVRALADAIQERDKFIGSHSTTTFAMWRA
jgi:hypothetical protein